MEAKELPKADSEPFQLSLRIRHPSMDPAEISRALKIEADHAFRAGAPRPSRSSVAPRSYYADSYWLGSFKPPARPIDISFPGDERSQIAQRQLTATAKSLTWAPSLSMIRSSMCM